MLNFRATEPGGMSPPYLQGALMSRVQEMAAEAIPLGVGGEVGGGPMGATDAGRPARQEGPRGAPAWMRPQ